MPPIESNWQLAAGEPAGHFQEQGILKLRAGPPQTVAQHVEHAQADGGMGLQPRQEMPALQHQQVGRLQRHRLGGPGLAVEQGDLAEELALADDIERDFLSLGGIAADPHPAGQNRHHAGTGIALAEDDRPRAVLGDSGVGCQLGKFARIDMFQQGMLGEDGELVFKSRNGHSTFPPETAPFLRADRKTL